MTFKKIVLQMSGWALLVLGVAGLFLPFLQGILFIFAGLVILSSQYHWARRLMERVRQRYPKTGERVDEFLQKLKNWLHLDRDPGGGE